MNVGFLHSPIGYLEIGEEDDSIIYIKFIDKPLVKKEDKSVYLNKCISQLNEYFNGARKVFDLKLNPKGTLFQQDTWKQVIRIPYGQTRTYQQVAEKIGDPGAARAVGNANNKNPIPIIIPCHRVIGAQGKLTGYGGGIDKKKWLLNLEMTYSNSEMQLDLF